MAIIKPFKTDYFWIIVSIAFATFMARLDRNIVNVSLPTISDFFNEGSSKVALVILTFLISSSSTLLLFGRLGDKIGIKKIFVWGYVVFVLSSFWCGMANSIKMLIWARFVQGFGGAMLVSSALALIPRHMPKDQIGKSFGILSTVGALGTFIGAPIGGFITQYLSWRWVFLINIPVGILAIIAASSQIPKDEVFLDKGKSLDYPGAILSFISISAFVYSLNIGNKTGWGSFTVLTLFSVSLISMICFIIWELKCDSPMLDFSLFKIKGFSCAILATFIGFMPITGSNFLIPFYLQRLYGLTPEKIGLVILCYSIVLILVSPFSGKLSDKINPSYMCVFGMFLGGIVFVSFAFILHIHSLLNIILFMMGSALSYAIFVSPNNNLVMKMAPRAQQSSVSGILNTGISLAAILGVSGFELIYLIILKINGIVDKSQLMASSNKVFIMTEGYKYAFLFGGFLCFVTLVLSFLVNEKKKNTDENPKS